MSGKYSSYNFFLGLRNVIDGNDGRNRSRGETDVSWMMNYEVDTLVALGSTILSWTGGATFAAVRSFTLPVK